MTTFFTILGYIFASLIVLAGLYFIIPTTVWFFKKHIKPTLNNLRIGLFGMKKAEKGHYLEAWNKWYSDRPGIRKHFHSSKHLKKFAYKRFLKEVRREIHEQNILKTK